MKFRLSRITQNMAFGVIWLFGGIALAALVIILGYIVFRGFYTIEDKRGVFFDEPDATFRFKESDPEPFVLFVNRYIRLNMTDTATLRKIFSGATRDYNGLSGQDEDIVLYTLSARSPVKNRVGTAVNLAEAKRMLSTGRTALLLADASYADELRKATGARPVLIRDSLVVVNEEVLSTKNNKSIDSLPEKRRDRLFSGKESNWMRVGGIDLPIVAVTTGSWPRREALVAQTPGAYTTAYIDDLESSGLGTLSFSMHIHRRNMNLGYIFTAPKQSGASGGFSTIILNTIFMVALTLVFAAPLGIGAAIYVTQYAKPGVRLRILRIAVETLSGVPSVIFGLFGFIVFVGFFNLGIGLLSGCLTISLMVLPTIMRSAEEALKTVPPTYRDASMALGADKWQTIWRVLVPAARSGILTGILLAVGRALGETAALVFTMGFDYRLLRGLHGSARVLSTHLYMLVKEGISMERAFAAATLLAGIILAVNLGASALIGGKRRNG